MTQPALSRMVHVMEERLSQTLFDRHTRGMRPKVAADLLAPYARVALFEMGEAIEALEELRGLRRGTVRVGAVATVARAILPDATRALLSHTAGLRVQLLEAQDDQLIKALIERDVDLILTADAAESSDLVRISEFRYNDAYTAFCAADPTRPERLRFTCQRSERGLGHARSRCDAPHPVR
jgi:DNA-binding transcriptional LysR family regulator